MASPLIRSLLIEEDPIHAKLVSSLLAKAEAVAFDVVIADTLSRGLAHLEQGGIDVVLLDLVLPDSQELETFLRVRADAPHLPVVILSWLDGDEILNDRGIFILPDVLANAGGVTASYFEWVPGTQNYMWSLEEINSRLRKIMSSAFRITLERSQRDHVDMRTAALIEGIDRITQAKLLRGIFP